MRGNGICKIIVEFLRDVARQLQMLLLVFAYGNMGCAVNQNVGGHQGWVGVKPDRHVFAIFTGLFLELRHAVQPPKPRRAIEHPSQFGMLGHLALVENNMLFRVNAAGDKGRRHFADIVGER